MLHVSTHVCSQFNFKWYWTSPFSVWGNETCMVHVELSLGGCYTFVIFVVLRILDAEHVLFSGQCLFTESVARHCDNTKHNLRKTSKRRRGKTCSSDQGLENFMWNLPDELFLIIFLGILHWHEWKKEGQFEDGHVNSNQEKARESLDKVAGCEAMLKHVYKLQGRFFCLYMLMAMAAMSSNICVCTRPGNMMKLRDCDWARGQVHQVHKPCMFCFDDVSFCWVDSLEPCKT